MRLADGAALASVAVRLGALAGAPSSAATCGEAVLLEPEPLRARRRRARARARRARARARHRQRAVTSAGALAERGARSRALLPPPAEAAELARSVLVGLAEGTIELPPKPAIHPRPDALRQRHAGLLARGSTQPGVKLVSVFPEQPRARACPRSRRVVIVLDSATGLRARPARRRRADRLPHRRRLRPPASPRSRRPRPATSRSPAPASRRARTCWRCDALGRRDVVVWDHRAGQPGCAAGAGRPSTRRPSTLRDRRQRQRRRPTARRDRDHGHPDRRRAAARVDPQRAARGRPRAADRLLDVDHGRDRQRRRAAARRRRRAARRLPRRALRRLARARRAGRPLAGRRRAAHGPRGQVVVANLGVGAHDVVFAQRRARARRARRASATLVSAVSARRAASRSSGSGSSA